MSLHGFQSEAIARVQAEYRAGHRAVILQIPTGGGKSHSAIEGVIVPSVARGRRVLFAADLDELLTDASERIAAAGLTVSTVKGATRFDPAAQVYVASLQTLASREQWPFDPATVQRVIIDEAHISAAATHTATLGRLSHALVLGLTATPARGDDRPLEEFTSLVCGPSMRWLQETIDPHAGRSYLVPSVVFSPPRALDKGVAEDPVDALLRRGAGRRAVIFAPSASIAADIAGRLTAAGHPTFAVLDSTPTADRRSVRARLATGEIRHVVTVRALLKGFDAPILDCAVLASPMGTVTSYLQAVGRVLRSHPGKRDALVLDLRGAVYAHGLPEDDRAWSLDGAQGRAALQALGALRRCKDCHAVGAFSGRCPRCGSRSIVDPRPLHVQRAELEDQRGVLPAARAAGYVARGVNAILKRKPKLPRAIAESIILKGAPAWVREALAPSVETQ